MKVIDLLNKIAKGEEVIHFSIYGEKYYVDKDGYIKDRGGNVNWLIYEEWLNTEIEIIEEKEIEKIKSGQLYRTGDIQTDYNFQVCEDKINQLIDELNKIKKEGK